MKWFETLVSLIGLRIKNRREFRVIFKTYRLACRIMQNQNNGLSWDEGDDFSKVLIVFLVKNAHRLQSIKVLCKGGLAKDAVLILRSMFEDLVDLKYMMANKERVKDFIDYDTYQRYKLGLGLERMTAKNIDRPRTTQRTIELREHWEKIKHRFMYETKNGKMNNYPRWTRGTVREISNDVGLGEQYEYLYSYLSNYAHSNPISANDYVSGRNKNKVVLVIGASPDFVGETSATASGIYLDMLHIANEQYKMNLDNLISPVEELLKRASVAREK